MRPLIGICANYSMDDEHGLMTGQGALGQEWQMLADDYINAVEKAGGNPIILPITHDLSNAVETLRLLDGIIFSGGTDATPQFYGEPPKRGLETIDPRRDRHEIELAKIVFDETNIPVLGVCRGIQILNVAFGGTLYQDLAIERPKGFNHSPSRAPKDYPSHAASICEPSRLYSIFKQPELMVNSFHHQGIQKLADRFTATMTAEDGLIEGMEMPGDRFVVAVQWHPEMMVDRYPEYAVIFDAFVACCIENRDRS